MHTKTISSRQIAMAFTGSFLGAGFVSGQELLQFFGVFGLFGIAGMFISLLLFFTFGCLVLKIAYHKKLVEFDKVIIKNDLPKLRAALSMLFILFLFTVVVVMTAGAGALLQQVTGFPPLVGSALMAILLAFVSSKGASGVIRSFGITVPLLITVAVLTGIISFYHTPGNEIAARPFSGENPLLGNWFFAMLSFVSYNMIGAISILVPIASYAKKEQTLYSGILQGTLQLALVFACILFPLILNQAMLAGSQLPMLALANHLHPVLGAVYAMLLFCGMFGSALSCLFGTTARIKKYNNILKINPSNLLVFLAFIGSLAGFKELISILFPICGYFSFLAMLGIFHHFLSLPRNSN